MEIEYPDSIWEVTRLIVERYVEADLVEARMSALRAQNRVLLWLGPERFTIHTMGRPGSTG